MTKKSPDAYRTISEAGQETDLPAHVLRFWESKFAQLKPLKRAGGRRLYRPQDIKLIKGLRRLLYDEGYTIKGAQKYLRDHGVAQVSALADADSAPAPVSPAFDAPAEPDASTVSEATDLFDAARANSDARLSDEARAAARQALRRLEAAQARLRAALQSD